MGIVACAFALGSAPAFAAAPERIEVRGLQPADLFALADKALSEGRDKDAEAIYDALTADPSTDIRNEARFRHARLLKAEGHLGESAVLLRQVVDEQPKAQPARLELAGVLAKLGDIRAAGRELRTAQAAGLPKDVALVANQFSLALRSLRPFGGSLEVGIAPDTNINRATRSDTIDTIIAPFELSKDAKAKSGIGLNVAGQAYVRHWFSDAFNLQAQFSERSSLYRDKEFNDVVTLGQVTAQLNLGGNRISPSLGRNYRFFGGKRYSVTDSAALNWQRPVGRAGLAEVEVSTGRSNYQLNDLQDGWVHEASIAFESPLTSTLGARVTLSGVRQTAKDPAYATKAGGGSLLVWKQIDRMSLFGSATARHLEADGRVFLYPAIRKEWFTAFSAGATFRQLTWRGFAPLLRVTYERNNSSLTLYDYKRLSTTIGFTRAF